MSQVTATTTAPFVTVVCSGAPTTTMTVTIALTCMGLATALGQHFVVLPPPLILKGTMKGIGGLTSVLQQLPQS